VTDSDKAKRRFPLEPAGFLAWLWGVVSMGLAAYGDMNDNATLRAVGIASFLIAFLVFGHFVSRALTRLWGPDWNWMRWLRNR
jgi:hypothetical protein